MDIRRFKWEKIDNITKKRLELERREFLVYNTNQGGCLSLVKWDSIQKHFISNGIYYNINDYSFWCPIPAFPTRICYERK